MHEMTLLSEHEGTETWKCGACARVVLIEWEPFRRVVIVKGDSVKHTGFKEIKVDEHKRPRSN